jgi:hypothetical protein
MVYFGVEDIDGTLKKVKNSGGKILNPKIGIGEYGFVGHFEDSEGNRVGLHSAKQHSCMLSTISQPGVRGGSLKRTFKDNPADPSLIVKRVSCSLINIGA